MRNRRAFITMIAASAGVSVPMVTLPQNLLVASPVIEDFEVLADWSIGGTGANNTTQFKTGTQSIKHSTPSGTVGSITKTSTMDLTNALRVGIWIYCHDKTMLTSIRLDFWTNTSGTNRYSVTASTVLVTGWNFLSYKKADFTATGSPNWATVEKLNYRVTPVGGQVAENSFDTLTRTDSAKPAVMFQFDDARASTYSIAFPIMQQYGLRGTLYVATSWIGTAGYMTWPQVAELAAAGWTIGNHTRTHTTLTTLTEAQQETEISNGYNDLVAQGYTDSAKYLAYPSGAWNADTKTAMTNLGMRTGRTTDPHTARLCVMPPWDVYEVQVSPITTEALATVTGYIDSAISLQTLLPMLFHNINAAGEMSTANFTALCAYWNSVRAQIPALTADDYYRLLSGSVSVPA